MNSNQVKDLRVGEEVICSQDNPNACKGEILTVIWAGSSITVLRDSQERRFKLNSAQVCTYFNKHYPDNQKAWINGKDVTVIGMIYTPSSPEDNSSTIANAAIANMILNCREEDEK